MENQSQALGIFIEKLMEEKGFENLDPEVAGQIKKDLLDRIENRINMTILHNLPPEKLEEFNKLLDQPNEEQIQKFCRNNISNLDEIIAETLMNFRNIYLNA